MTAIARLAAVSLGSVDPIALATFYRQLLDTALALGATKAETQPSPDRWPVLLDPAGHPFCITTLILDV